MIKNAKPLRSMRVLRVKSVTLRSTKFTHTVLPSGPFIWGRTRVKNEADIIEQTIRYLLNQGVEYILVADNGFTDGTY
ncbi:MULTISPECIES: glycosyltransferase family 2 protein [Rothia]|nr:glycosyltransferase family 2 protein [Rothia dentocariosa]